MSAQGWKQITANGLWPALLLAGTDDRCAPDEQQIAACRMWIRLHAQPTPRVHGRAGTSYGLKHAVERWTRRCGFDLYVANGAFIEAATREGYRLQRTAPGSPNAHFNMRVRRAPKGGRA